MTCRKIQATLLLIAVAAAIVGCGSGSSSSTGTEPSLPSATKRTQPLAERGKNAEGQGEEASRRDAGAHQADSGNHRAGGVPGDTRDGFQPPPHHDSGGGVKQFESKGGDNSIQESGSEASGPEFAAAAAALHAYLDARAAGAWAVACEYLSPGAYEPLTEPGGGGGPSCPEVLARLSGGLPQRALREVAVADVGSFRVEGDSGFILFHGAHGADWFAPMVREDGHWKVGAIAPSALS